MQVPEEERIAALVAANPKLSAVHRKEYEDKMQTFFSNVRVVMSVTRCERSCL